MCLYRCSSCKFSFYNLFTVEIKDLVVIFFLILLAYLRAHFIINGFLFLHCSCFLPSSSACNLRCPCVFCSHVKCQNRKLFWGVGFLQEVLRPKRLLLLTAEGQREDRKRKQVKQAQKLSDTHTHLYPKLNLNLRM